MSHAVTNRRTLLAAAGAASLAAGLTACGDSGSSDGGTDPESSEGGTGAPEGGQPEGGGEQLASTGDIPEGGGAVFQDEKVVVVQPSGGEFKAYSAECTHKGCLVAEVSDGSINCLCHGSKFSIADGSVTAGPAQQPLSTANITVEGDAIRLA